MRHLRHVFVPVLLLFSPWAIADEDLGLGPWRLGMSREEVTSHQDLGPYQDVRVTGGVETANAKFAGHTVNTSFVFDDAGLAFIQVWNYEGEDWKKAQGAVLEVFDYFSERYGGVTVPGVEVNGSETLDRGALAVVLQQVLGTARELDAKVRKDQATMTMIFDMIPLRQPQESRLHCQWVYAGRPDTFYVFLFQDRKDAPSRRVASNVQLERL